MRKLNLFLALLLMGTMTALVGCGSKPPETAKKAEKMEAFEEEAPAETTTAEETTPAPVEEEAMPTETAEEPPAEEPAPAEETDTDDWDELSISSMSGQQDLGIDEPAAQEEEMEEESAAPETAEDAETTEAAPAEAVDEPAAAAGNGAVTYAITPNDDSYIGWVGYGGIMGSMEGGFANFEGTLTLPESGDFTQGEVTATVQMDSIFSTSKALTTKLKDEHFFEVDKFPTATFKSVAIEKADDGGYNVKGNMTLRDNKFGVILPVDMEMDGEDVKVTSELTFNRFDWGVEYEGTGDNFIKDDALVEFEILAEKQAQ
jgi:polyisoprenoid-binding protein YceI